MCTADRLHQDAPVAADAKGLAGLQKYIVRFARLGDPHRTCGTFDLKVTGILQGQGVPLLKTELTAGHVDFHDALRQTDEGSVTIGLAVIQ